MAHTLALLTIKLHYTVGVHITLLSSVAVNGKQIYSKTPSYIKDGEDDVGRGRLIPSTAFSVTTLLKNNKFANTDIGIIPYINNFAQKNLGLSSTVMFH